MASEAFSILLEKVDVVRGMFQVSIMGIMRRKPFSC